MNNKRSTLIAISILVIIAAGIIFMSVGYGSLNIDAYSQTIKGSIIETGSEEMVIIIPGSGPTDRNGNSPLLEGYNDSLRMVAAALEDAGISSYRYDKQKGSPEMTFDDFILDLVEVVRFFRSEGYGRIYLAGHSQGSLVAMAAANIEPVEGVVSLSGPGRSIDKVLADQLDMESIAPYLDRAKQGDSLEEETPLIQYLFSKETLNFMTSWIAYDPVKEIQKLDIPILLILGTADSQVSQLELEILSMAKPDADVLLIEQMNHVLKIIENEEEDVRAYSSPDYPLSDIMINEMVKFVHD